MWSQISSIRKREGERYLSTHGGRSSQLRGSREELTPVVLLDDSFFQTKTHSFAVSYACTHAHIYISIFIRTRACIFNHARARFGRKGWVRAAWLERGSPHHSAPRPLSLHWRAGDTRAPGRSGSSETEQTGRASWDVAAATE